MIFIANVFPKLQTVKSLVRPLYKKGRFRTRFDTQHVNASQILANSPWGHIYHVFPSISENLIRKMCPLVLAEILLVFVNTLTADDKYRAQHCKNLALPIQMQLDQKQNTFSEKFCAISGIYIKF